LYGSDVIPCTINCCIFYLYPSKWWSWNTPTEAEGGSGSVNVLWFQTSRRPTQNRWVTYLQVFYAAISDYMAKAADYGTGKVKW